MLLKVKETMNKMIEKKKNLTKTTAIVREIETEEGRNDDRHMNSKENDEKSPKRLQICDLSHCCCYWCGRVMALLRQRTSCSSGHPIISKFKHPIKHVSV